MRITQGTFSYLPELTDEEICAQVHPWPPPAGAPGMRAPIRGG